MTAFAERFAATLVAGHIDAHPGPRPFVLGIAGGVCVGKTTLAGALAEAFAGGHGLTVAVLTTDHFLHPNDELAHRGLLTQKGFPDTYDVALLRSTVDRLRAGAVATVPVYSHQTYDRTGDTTVIEPTDVLVVEGVNVLQPDVAALVDASLYIEVSEDDARAWFHARFDELCTVGDGFYAAFRDRGEQERRAVADAAWSGINVVNLHEHISPTKVRATYVATKSATHEVIDLAGPSPPRASGAGRS